ncbi:MAG: cytochrome b/b6 domain-containing protein [Planctomycetia bacterium]|nr:cytochrome b/b6 domain-containing protein [Planctomycetia bacterium]
MKNVNAHKVRTDIILLLIMLVLCLHSLTGDALHEWLGVILIPVLLWHLYLNWDWIKSVLKRFFTRQTFLTRVNLVWDWLLYATMGFVILSGILISRDFLSRLGISVTNDAFLSYVHHRLTVVLFVMIGIHLGLHIRWIARQFSGLARPTKDSATSEVASSGEPSAKKKQGSLLTIAGRVAVLATVGLLLACLILPVGRTSWSDGVREQVRKARAAKRKGPQQNQAQLPNIKQEANHAGGNQPESNSEMKPQNADTMTNVPAEKQTSEAAKKVSGPKAKPPQFSAHAAAELVKFLSMVGVPFLFVSILMIFAGGSWRKQKSLL